MGGGYDNGYYDQGYNNNYDQGGGQHWDQYGQQPQMMNNGGGRNQRSPRRQRRQQQQQQQQMETERSAKSTEDFNYLNNNKREGIRNNNIQSIMIRITHNWVQRVCVWMMKSK